MKKSCTVIFVLIAGFVWGQAAAQEAPVAAGTIIGVIETAGNITVTRAQILSRVRSRAGQAFDAAAAAEDARRIAGLEGVEYAYYNTALVEGKVKLMFVVVEKNIVRSIVFVGNRKFKAKTLRKKLDLKVGDYMDVTAAQAGVDVLIEYYRKKGFPFVEVELSAEKLSRGEAVYIIGEGPRVKVKSVKFSGNRGLKSGSLKKAVKTKTRRFFILSSYYNQEKTEGDVERLKSAYYRRGFLDAEVAARREFSQDRRRVRISFDISEGQVYTVESIGFTGVEYFGEDELVSQLKLGPGQVFSERSTEADHEQLLKAYRELGFVDARVERNIRFVSENTVSIGFDVSEGERFRIGRVIITGNEKTQDKVVRRVLDEYDFQPGQWYNADIARGDATGSGYLEELIRRTVYAESAHIRPAGEQPGQRDAQVSIIEGQTGMVMLGAGASADAGVIGQLVYEERNFDISDWPDSFSEFIRLRGFRGAGQHLRIALEPGTEVSQYSISFTEPYLKDKPVSLDVVGSSWERDRESYEEGRLKGYFGFEKRYKNRWRRGIAFRVENVEVGDLDIDAPQEIRDVKGDNLLAGIKISVGRDLTDDVFNPSSGRNYSLSYEQVGGDETFGILSGIYRRYRTLHVDLAERKTILATKFLAATTIGDAPPFERFYAGGSGLYGIRGFEYRGVSTRGLQTNTTTPERKDPIGSDWIFLANAEVTVPLISENFALLVFVDSGAIDTGDYRAAVGTGIQILIPQWFGPVPMRFSIAAPMMKDGEDEEEVFSFSVGRLF
jgi:outer membrane protein insertion porin family